ncbi:glycoside hydrolase family 16 protein [Rubellicoccus peritrichatus]|uniref:Glycoside hydrolase family 16 protein n=1 Tax=Rubellicoccus peritrichatus TaxID=3080537 RepID=A0AAQ3LAT2_9BACT|nr:glycoside hydrolase family 16 protein [Puniceicoccus sp. CR14]WOO40093.1 glycoside hydrolase family 16 protein [Puniceicoccus sp. CR14]
MFIHFLRVRLGHIAALIGLLSSFSALQYANARNWDKDTIELEYEMKPSDDSVTLTPKDPHSATGLVVDFAEGGGGYPGVSFLPMEGDSWDLSDFTCVEVKVTSLGEKPVYVTARVENPGEWQKKPWNSNATRLQKGDTKIIRIFFGYSFRKAAYPLDKSDVSRILVHTGNASPGQSLRIDSIQIKSTPVPFKPNVAPKDGYLLGSANAAPLKYYPKEGAKYTAPANEKPLSVTFSAKDQSLVLAPEGGALWDLRQGYQLLVKLSNSGKTSISPAFQVISDKGKTDIATAVEPLAAGESGEITVSFIQKKPRDASIKNPFFENNKVKALVVSANGIEGTQSFEIESIRLTAPPVKLPDWVGKRPPVDGDWVLTLNEEFEGDTLDDTIWQVYAPNYWDKISRFSKDNVNLVDGNAVLTFEKRFGPHNDDPDYPRSNDYTTGFLETYGKWVQLYGYFEARMKLPRSPGLWPAFWLMPDRGPEAGEQWRRQHTGFGGMEFDIMEFLSGWGPYRFTTAFHYDGYKKDHKAKGAGSYTGHDEEGYVTTGLLWLPGLAVIYNNGEEIVRWESDRISHIKSGIIFTFVAGGWDNEPLDDKLLPDEFLIDYVRVWQRADLARKIDDSKLNQDS